MNSTEPDLAVEWAASAWRHLELSIPVDLRKVCRQVKLYVRQADLGHTAGHLMQTPKRFYAVINSRDHLERQRFTLAHEIGEYLLLQHYKRHGWPVLSNSYTERFCDRFAVHLLMPSELVREQAAEVGHCPRRNDKTVVLASRFGVSEQAMRARLVELIREVSR